MALVVCCTEADEFGPEAAVDDEPTIPAEEPEDASKHTHSII